MWGTSASLRSTLLPRATTRAPSKRLRYARTGVVVLACMSILFGVSMLHTLQGRDSGAAEVITTSHMDASVRAVAVPPLRKESQRLADDRGGEVENEEAVASTELSHRSQPNHVAAIHESGSGPTPTPRLSRVQKPSLPDHRESVALNEDASETTAPSTTIPTPSTATATTIAPTPSPPPSRTKDPWFANPQLFPTNAATHNEAFIARSAEFDHTVSRDKGIIISLHDHVMPLGLSLVKELRCLGNHELIQVYHCLPADLSLANTQLLVSQDDRLEVIDVCSDLMNAGVFSEKQAAEFKSWWTKPLAMHHTRLLEPILLDADDFLLHNPAIIRNSDGYKQSGTLFFYDRVLDWRIFIAKTLSDRGNTQLLHYMVANLDYEAFGLSGPQPTEQLVKSMAYQGTTSTEMDSSMVAIDKSRSGKAMDVLWWLATSFRFNVDFSYGDKESFWLAFELAHQPYAFSPWGVSVVSASCFKDMEEHPETLCGSIAQYYPNSESEPAQLFYVNGKAVLDPLQSADNPDDTPNRVYNANVTHVVPRMRRTTRKSSDPTTGKGDYSFPLECLVGLGSTPVPAHFQRLLSRRRLHYSAVVSGELGSLDVCELYNQ